MVTTNVRPILPLLISLFVTSFGTVAAEEVMLFSATGMIIPDKIRVGCDRDYPPLSSLVEGKPSGFDVELMGLLSEQSGVPFIILPDYWSQVIKDLKTGRIDAVSGILKTDQRAPYFDFTLPYLTENYALFSHHGSNIRGLGDLPGKSAAILRNDAAVSTFFIPNKLEDNLILTESFTQALKLVAENQTDYTIAPLSLGKSILKSLGLERRIKISRTLFPVEYRMAVTRGNRELLFLLNESNARLQKSGELQELIRKKHISVPHSISTVPPASPLLIGSGILLVLMFLGIILGRSLLRYRIEKAVKEVTAAKEYFESLLEEIPLPLYWRDKTFQITGSNKRMRAFLHAEKTGSQDKTPAPGADESDFSGFFGEMERADVLTWNTGQAQDLKLQTSPGTGSIHSYPRGFWGFSKIPPKWNYWKKTSSLFRRCSPRKKGAVSASCWLTGPPVYSTEITFKNSWKKRPPISPVT